MSTSPYNEAGKLLTKILMKNISLKTASFGTSEKKQLSCSKTAYAQVSNTLAYKSVIDDILNYKNGTWRKVLQFDGVHNKGLFYVLLYELLFGKYKTIRGGGVLKRTILQYEHDLRSTVPLVCNSTHAEISNPIVSFPRYVRINTLKATVAEVIDTLKRDLKALHTFTKDGEKSPANPSDTQHPTHIYVDDTVPELFVLSAKCGIDWNTHELVVSGKIVLQDKSSCFPALALVHGRGEMSSGEFVGDFIDACAAPGNKTSQLAALVAECQRKRQTYVAKSGQKRQMSKSSSKEFMSRIFAFDRSSTRFETLCQRIKLLEDPASTHVEIVPIHDDFLKVDPSDQRYAHVRSILLDPSCSGSGIINTPDRLLQSNSLEQTKDTNQRMEALSKFQLLALKHAMSFPQVHKIVYSTCSIHKEENESVVHLALEEVNHTIVDDSMKWVLVSPFALRYWPRRGLEHGTGLTKQQISAVIRVDGKDGDETNGFFVSYFERGGICTSSSVAMEKSTVQYSQLVDGLYDGQFRPTSVAKDVDRSISADRMEVNTHSAPLTTRTQKIASSKKIRKKMEWKDKQKQQKLDRLRSKKNRL